MTRTQLAPVPLEALIKPSKVRTRRPAAQDPQPVGTTTTTSDTATAAAAVTEERAPADIAVATLSNPGEQGIEAPAAPKDLLLPGEPVALDFEFQNFKHEDDLKWSHRVGRAAIVNYDGEVILDVYAAYPKADKVRKLMPRIGGEDVFQVRHEDFFFQNGAKPAHVEKWIADIVKDRIVVVHGGQHDLMALQYEKDAFRKATKVVDTQSEYYHLHHRSQPGLAYATERVLGRTIQEEDHDATEDVKATMGLFRELKNKYPYDREAEKARFEQEGQASGQGRRTPGGGHAGFVTTRARQSRNTGDRVPRNGKGTAMSGRLVHVAKRGNFDKNMSKVENFELSIADEVAFPALG